MKLRTKFFLWMGKEVLDDMDDDIYQLKAKTKKLAEDGNFHIYHNETLTVVNDGEYPSE